VFDETFFFNFKGLSRAEVEEAVIKVLVGRDQGTGRQVVDEVLHCK
jgi:hypothetical protein